MFSSEWGPINSGWIWILRWNVLLTVNICQLCSWADVCCVIVTCFPPDYDPLPHVPVVEMVSDDEVSEVESLSQQFPPKWAQSTSTRTKHHPMFVVFLFVNDKVWIKQFGGTCRRTATTIRHVNMSLTNSHLPVAPAWWTGSSRWSLSQLYCPLVPYLLNDQRSPPAPLWTKVHTHSYEHTQKDICPAPQ